MERQDTLLNPIFNRQEAKPSELLTPATSPAATSATLPDFCERLHAVRSSSPQYARYLETVTPL